MNCGFCFVKSYIVTLKFYFTRRLRITQTNRDCDYDDRET